MTIALDEPRASRLVAAVTALRSWQVEGSPMQLHPGDIGWYGRFGTDATAAAVRTWSSDDRILAVGLLDGPDLLRLAFAPEARHDEKLARRLADDIDDPERGVLPQGPVSIEVPDDAGLREPLLAAGWVTDEAWTPLRRKLADPVTPVDRSALRIEEAGPDRAAVHAAVVRAAFDRSTFTAERWHAMTAGPAYADARSLVGYDQRGDAVAAVTVWRAGPGRPGLLEPMGVHHDHRGHGYGRAITVAGAGALQALGSSSAIVATPSSNLAGIATYESAGFVRMPERLDLRRAG
jgi:ribosomal protein S18 acetylase RimI-like enzyme